MTPARPPGTASRSRIVTFRPGAGQSQCGAQAAQAGTDDDHVLGRADHGSGVGHGESHGTTVGPLADLSEWAIGWGWPVRHGLFASRQPARPASRVPALLASQRALRTT